MPDNSIRYGSLDTRHVQPPDPTSLWPFEAGTVRVIGLEPLLTFQVNAIIENRIEGTQVLGDQAVNGELHLNYPVVICRDPAGLPLVTLTLRRVEYGKAFLQVTASPAIRVGTRQ
jgi:hypothetical protein